jgi:lysozyme
MTTPALTTDLIADEGLREKAYRDGGGVWTIGVGHTGRDVRDGLVWTRAACLAALAADVAGIEHGLDLRLPWWRDLNGARQDALANLAFNLGVEGLVGFAHMLAALRSGDYALAAQHLLASEPWRSQVGARAERLARQIETGAPRPGPAS